MKLEQLQVPATSAAAVNLYCCGGAGINQGAEVDKLPWFNKPGYAKVNPVYLDTSTSNFRGQKLAGENAYVFAGVDGSGGLQWTNSDKIAQQIPDALVRHPATERNIVVCSIGGGSGPVIALNLIQQLMAEDAMVTAIFTGDTSTGAFAHNTVQSLQNFSSMVSRFDKRSLPLTAFLNTPRRPRSSVDMAVHEYIGYYAALFSDTLHGLDSSDIFNWANQERLSVGVKAPLTIVSAVFTDESGGQILIDNDTNVNSDAICSVLSMHRNRDDAMIGGGDFQVPYIATGYMVDDYSDLKLKGNLNMVAYTDALGLYEQINGQKAAAQKVFKARTGNRTIPAIDSGSGFSFS